MKKWIAAGALLGALLVGPAQAAKLANGDFEAGNVGFQSDYGYLDYLCNQQTGNYTLAYDPTQAGCYGDWQSFGDHTTGTGLMMVVDGSTVAGQAFWSETVKVHPQTSYQLTYWARVVQGNDNGNATTIQVYADGVAVGNALILPRAADGVWYKGTAKWTSGSGKHQTISLVDRDTELAGNDFAVDDIKMKMKKK